MATLPHLPRIFFAHANGFTPGAYEPLLRTLRPHFAVEAPPLLPLRTGHAPSGRWAEIADDLGQLLDERPLPTVGVGHSLGAVTLLMAAATRPARFDRLVLIEPPAIPAWGAALLRHAPATIRQKGAMAAAARRRTDRWASFEDAIAQERSRRWFARMNDEALAQMLRDGLMQEDGAWRLRFRKEWEARLYETPTSVWSWLRRPLPPITVLRGAESRVFDAADLSRWRRLRPQDRAVEVAEAGHLLPLERPEQVADLIGDSRRR